jgi:dipeptidase E
MFGRHGDTLVSMAGAGARVAIIANALDNLPDLRRDYLEQTVAPLFSAFTFKAEEVDLRNYFADQSRLRADLSNFGVLFAVGGNSFLLRQAMKLSGFDALIGPLLSNSGVIYGGWSAGSVVAGRDLFGIDHMDDPKPVAFGYPQEVLPQQGLSLIDGTLVPHFRSDHPEAPAADAAAEAISASGRRLITLRDGEVLIHDGSRCVLHR